MSKKNFLILIGVVVLFVIVAIIVFFPRGIVADGVKLYRFINEEGPSDTGHLRIPYAQTNDNPEFQFVNIAVDFNGDGKIEDYDVDGISQPEWVVRDMVAFPDINSSNRYTIDIPDQTIGESLPLTVFVVYSEDQLRLESWPEKMPRSLHEEEVVIEAYELEPIASLISLDPTGEMVGASAPIYDAQSTGMPDHDQGYNECAPTAVANAMEKLAKDYDFEDRMPDSTRELIAELKGDLQWRSTGVPVAKIIEGKERFISRRRLPLEVHLVSTIKNDEDILKKIADEIERGQTVEISIDFFTIDKFGKETRSGGHMATVTRATKFADAGYISLSDPATKTEPEDAGQDIYKIEGNEFVQKYLGSRHARIPWAYAQSPVFDGAGQLVYPDDQGVLPGSDTSVAKSRFNLFTVVVDQPGDQVVGVPFSAEAVVTRTGKKAAIPYWIENEEGEWEKKEYVYGAALPWSLKGSFLGRGPLTANFQDDLPPETSIGYRRYQISATFKCTKPGAATVIYQAELDWTHDGDDPPPEISENERLSEELVTYELIKIESPPFRCLPLPEETTDETPPDSDDEPEEEVTPEPEPEGDVAPEEEIPEEEAPEEEPPPPPPDPEPEPEPEPADSDEVRCKQVCGANRYYPAQSLNECSDIRETFLCIQNKQACFDYMIPRGWQTDSNCCCQDAPIEMDASGRINCAKFQGWDLNGFAVEKWVTYPFGESTKSC